MFLVRKENRTSGEDCPAWYHAVILPEGTVSVRLPDGESVLAESPLLYQIAACAVNLENGPAVIPAFVTLDVSSAAESLNFPRE